MKKALSLILAIVLCLSLCACGTSTNSGTANNSNTGNKTNNATNSGTANNSNSGKHTHDWKVATCSAPKTCLICGETEGNAAGHDWRAASCNKPKTCLDCGETEGTVASHDYKATKVVDATCNTTGYKQYSCTHCGDTYTEDIAKTAHNYIAATCNSPQKCSVCGETSGKSVDHKDNGKGYCAYCNENMNLALAKQKLFVKLFVPSSGTNNAYLSLEIKNHTGYTAILSSFTSGNGKLCYNSKLSDYELNTGYKINVSYYRGIIPSDWFDKKNYDMYLDENSWAYTVIKINGTDIFVKVNAKGDTVWGLSRSDIGVA